MRCGWNAFARLFSWLFLGHETCGDLEAPISGLDAWRCHMSSLMDLSRIGDLRRTLGKPNLVSLPALMLNIDKDSQEGLMATVGKVLNGYQIYQL